MVVYCLCLRLFPDLSYEWNRDEVSGGSLKERHGSLIAER